MKKNIVITGASGFIGQHLIDELSKEFTIFCLPFSTYSSKFIDSFPNVKIIHSLAEINDIYSVIHLAARVHQMNDTNSTTLEKDYFESNVNYPMSIAKIAIQKKVSSFIFLSSVKVYGETPGLYTENNRPNPTDLYGKSKMEAETQLSSLFHSSFSKLIILRTPLVYGPNNKGNMLSLLKYSLIKITIKIKIIIKFNNAKPIK